MYDRIKELREEHDLTQRMVADYLGITRRKYSHIETGTQLLTCEILIKLAQYYHVSADYIVGRTDDPEPYQ